eukprot:10654724-Heterocapsa_arctica.AAC.1
MSNEAWTPRMKVNELYKLREGCQEAGQRGAARPRSRKLQEERRGAAEPRAALSSGAALCGRTAGREPWCN